MSSIDDPAAGSVVSGGVRTYKVRLKKFRMRTLRGDSTVLIVGQRGTGKSTLLEDLLSYVCEVFDAAVAFTPTQDSAEMFQKFLPDSCIHEKYDPAIIERIVKTVRDLRENAKVRRIAVFLDDCMSEKGVLLTDAMREIHMNGRHLKFMFVNIAQYAMDVPKNLRSQIDYVFALRETREAFRKILYENFFSIFHSPANFGLAMDRCTSDRSCLLIDNRAISNEIGDCVYWYKAKVEHPPFLLGNRSYWKLHYMLYRPRRRSAISECPIPAFAPKRSEEGGGDDKRKLLTVSSDAYLGSGRTAKRGRRVAGKKETLVLEIDRRDEYGNVLVPEPEPAKAAPPAAPKPAMPKGSLVRRPPPLRLVL